MYLTISPLQNNFLWDIYLATKLWCLIYRNLLKHSLIQYLAQKVFRFKPWIYYVIMVSSSLSIRTCTIQINREFYREKNVFKRVSKSYIWREIWELWWKKKRTLSGCSMLGRWKQHPLQWIKIVTWRVWAQGFNPDNIIKKI